VDRDAAELDEVGTAFQLLDGLDEEAVEDFTHCFLEEEDEGINLDDDGRHLEGYGGDLVPEEDLLSDVELDGGYSVDDLVEHTRVEFDGRFEALLGSHAGRGTIGELSWFPWDAALHKQNVSCRCGFHKPGCVILRPRRHWSDEKMLRWFWAGVLDPSCDSSAKHIALATAMSITVDDADVDYLEKHETITIILYVIGVKT
jgi:hypothetical protein